MSKTELKEMIKTKELELKALKDQLKELESKEESTVITYNELSKLDSNSIIRELEKLDTKDIKKVARKCGIPAVPGARSKCINVIVEIIESRNNKGKAFK
ncbi:MAG: hypothetical protein ACRC18_07025 [Cetobacterium sp.]